MRHHHWLFITWLFCICSLSPRPLAAEQKTHIVSQGDTLWIIATKYYHSPSASDALYTRNEAVISADYDRFVKVNPTFDTRKFPKGPSTIFPGTVLSIPEQLVSKNDVYYTRSERPMPDADAEKVGKEKIITLASLTEWMRARRPKWRTPPSTSAFPGNPQQVNLTAGAASREATPAWYASPAPGIQTCAKSLCDKFKSLCYYECLSIAKRMSDGRASCAPLPDQLPYTTKSTTRQTCSDAIK